MALGSDMQIAAVFSGLPPVSAAAAIRLAGPKRPAASLQTHNPIFAPATPIPAGTARMAMARLRPG